MLWLYSVSFFSISTGRKGKSRSVVRRKTEPNLLHMKLLKCISSTYITMGSPILSLYIEQNVHKVRSAVATSAAGLLKKHD